MSYTTGSISHIIPFAHVADVVHSLRFYEALGLQRGSTVTRGDRVVWAELRSGTARLMLAAASGPVRADEQAVLFYMYTDDVRAIRDRLLQSGAEDGSVYRGGTFANHPMGMVFDVAHPSHMPDGEVRVHDPDGYVVLIGQHSPS
jgi:uncharacterized glyoxalase superfamily protein PhnB